MTVTCLILDVFSWSLVCSERQDAGYTMKSLRLWHVSTAHFFFFMHFSVKVFGNEDTVPVTWHEDPSLPSLFPFCDPLKLTFRVFPLLFTVAYLWKSTPAIYESNLKPWTTAEGLIFHWSMTLTIHSLFHRKKKGVLGMSKEQRGENKKTWIWILDNQIKFPWVL